MGAKKTQCQLSKLRLYKACFLFQVYKLCLSQRFFRFKTSVVRHRKIRNLQCTTVIFSYLATLTSPWSPTSSGYIRHIVYLPLEARGFWVICVVKKSWLEIIQLSIILLQLVLRTDKRYLKYANACKLYSLLYKWKTFSVTLRNIFPPLCDVGHEIVWRVTTDYLI